MWKFRFGFIIMGGLCVDEQRRKTMAQASGPPVATMEVHVTGRRVIATIVDGIILGVVFTVLSLLFGETSASGGNVSASLGTLGTLLLTVVSLAYFILMEGYMGQTVGKMIAGVKVVREDSGATPGLGKATIRTILRIIDGLFLYLVAFIVVLISGKNQRLGDMAAGTLVVRK
jgi:uncharacterized RDD family membrane protein YckC